MEKSAEKTTVETRFRILRDKIRVIILCEWRPLLGVAKYIKMNKNILKLLILIIGRNK